MARSTRRRSPITRTKVSSAGTLHVNGGDSAAGHLAEAAEKIAEGIRSRAAEFSHKIPPGVHVGQGTSTTATVYASIEPGYAIETGARHPLFAHGPKPESNNDPNAKGSGWDHWYPMKQILFMEEGAARALDAAAEAYGYPTIDDWIREVHW